MIAPLVSQEVHGQKIFLMKICPQLVCYSVVLVLTSICWLFWFRENFVWSDIRRSSGDCVVACFLSFVLLTLPLRIVRLLKEHLECLKCWDCQSRLDTIFFWLASHSIKSQNNNLFIIQVQNRPCDKWQPSDRDGQWGLIFLSPFHHLACQCSHFWRGSSEFSRIHHRRSVARPLQLRHTWAIINEGKQWSEQ